MERLKLGTKYGDITRHVASMLAAPQLQRDPSKNRTPCELCSILAASVAVSRKTSSTRVLIPSASTLPVALETNWKRRHLYSVPKEEAIIMLDARLHHDRFPLTFSKHLAEGDAFKQEIADFLRNLSGAGRMKYEARTGKHDDMVMALAIAVWWLSRPEPATAQGRYGYRTARVGQHIRIWNRKGKVKWKTKQTEIDNVVAGFTAAVMGLITHYRGQARRIKSSCRVRGGREQARMDRKFEAMLNDLSFAGLRARASQRAASG